MKKLYLVSGFILAALVVCIAPYCFSHNAGAPAYRYGTCGFEGCHMGGGTNPAGGMGIMMFDTTQNIVNRYEPGKTYTIQVDVYDGKAKAFGFEAAVLKGDIAGTSIGRLYLTDSKRMQFAESNADYITHTFESTAPESPGVGSWRFSWRAPGNDVGQISICAAGNGANADGTSFGDHIYTMVKTIASPTSAINTEAPLQDLKIFPNPASERITVNFFSGTAIPAAIKVYGVDGQVKSGKDAFKTVAGVNCQTLDVSTLPAGIYFLEISGSGVHNVQKFIKM